jgi:hypothetical protein
MACCPSVQWNSSISETIRDTTHVHIHFFCLEWPILWHPRIFTFPPGTSCIVSYDWMNSELEPMWKGSFVILFIALSRHLSGPCKATKPPRSRQSTDQAVIRTEHPRNTNQKRYRLSQVARWITINVSRQFTLLTPDTKFHQNPLSSYVTYGWTHATRRLCSSESMCGNIVFDIVRFVTCV